MNNPHYPPALTDIRLVYDFQPGDDASAIVSAVEKEIAIFEVRFPIPAYPAYMFRINIDVLTVTIQDLDNQIRAIFNRERSK